MLGPGFARTGEWCMPARGPENAGTLPAMSYALNVQQFLDRAQALFPEGTLFMIAVPQPARKDGEADQHKVYLQGGGDGGTALDMLAALQSAIEKRVENTAQAMGADTSLGVTAEQVHEAFAQLVNNHHNETETTDQSPPDADAPAPKPPPRLVKGPALKLVDACGMPIEHKPRAKA